MFQAEELVGSWTSEIKSINTYQIILVFEERGKPEYPEKNLSEQIREPTNSTHIWRCIWESNQGSVSRKSRNFTGVTIPFVSQERRGFKSSNLTDMFLLVSLKTYSKIGFSKQAVGSFTNGFLAPKRFRDFRETGPRVPFLESPETLRAIFGCHNSLCISRMERI